jgi:hypothetical protein
VLGAAGEVHLETCIKDLTERFAKIELQVGAAAWLAWLARLLLPLPLLLVALPLPGR